MKRMYQQPTTETLRVEAINAVLSGSRDSHGDDVTEGDGGDLP